MQHKSSKCALIDNILALAKLMGIKNDKKINFKNHIDEIWEKAGQKLNALSRVTTYMDLPKPRMLLSAFSLLLSIRFDVYMYKICFPSKAILQL